MFRYENFPEINKAHKKYNKLVNRYTRAHIKYNKSGSKNESIKWKQGLQAAKTYGVECYSRIVFNIFSLVKPNIKDITNGAIYAWDDLYGQDFEKLPFGLQKSISMMVEDEFPFLLPDEYYDDRPLYK